MSELASTLRVLGVPALHGPDGEQITFRTRKHFALLIYLALEPATHRREKLGALLWPRATTAESRHSLATGLSVLRARLGKARIETTRDTARLVPGSLEIDLDRLARGEIHATETTPALAVAPLLQEFVVADAAPWDLWRDALSAKWQPTIRDALLARIERSRRQGNTKAMELLADALLSLDDLSEEGVRAKMESRAFAGDRLTALQIYEDWRVRLADELGAQPSELVAGMALRLRRRGWERTSGEHIPSVRTDQWKDRPFVGRAREYEVLYEGWEGCQRGVLRHVLLTGESGVGKSTLVERLTTAAGLQGAVACRIQCHEVEREIPYGAIGGLITLLLDRPGASAVAPEWLSELSRTVSGVRRRFPNVAPAPEATGEMVRIRLADALHELVRAIAEEQPLILVMDDIHLGDDASVAVMHLLLRRLTDEHLLVICTLRQGEGNLAPSARGMLERAEIAQMSVVPLPPLTEGESTELLGQLVPGEVAPPPSTVRRALLRAGGGLPMLLELLIRDWLAHGDRCVALAVEAMTEEPGTAGGAGETYRRLLERLTLGLDPSTRSVLNLAAVLGSQLNEFDLYGLVDLTLAQAMSGLSHLAALRILRDSGHGLEFVNEVMRGEVYLSVPSSVRKVLHSKVADRLIERATAGEEMLGLAIAWHCMRSSRVQEAGEWLIKGGKEAIARSALAEAEAALESGIRHLPGAFQVGCGILLTETLIDQGRYSEAITQPQALLSFAGTQQAAHLNALQTLAETMSQRGSTGSPAEDIDQILAQAHAVDSPEHRLRVATVAVGFASRTLTGAALECADAFLERVSEPDRRRFPIRYPLLKAQVYYHQRRVGDATALLEALSASNYSNGPALQQVHVLLGLAACKAMAGDYSGAVEPLLQAGRASARAGSPYYESHTTTNLALVYLRLGALQQAEAFAERSYAKYLSDRIDTGWLNVVGVRIVIAALRGDIQAFDERLRDGMTVLARSHPSASAASLRLWIADGLQLVGRHEEAARHAAHVLESIEEFPLGMVGRATRWAGVLLGTMGSGQYLAQIERSSSLIHQLDALDQFEVACTCLTHLTLDTRARGQLEDIAHGGATNLSQSTIDYLRRAGLSFNVKTT